MVNHVMRNESGLLQNLDLENFLPYQLAVLANHISLEFSQTYREKFGISIPEWRVMAHLSQADKVSVREIYRKVTMDKSKVSRAAARLEKSGYIRKITGKEDKRLVELSLTKSGQAMAAEISELAHAYEAKILDQLGADQSAAFRAGLKTLLAQRT